MNNDERRRELLDKANSMIDTISESMRMVENVESAKKKFLRADSELALHLPIEGCGGTTDMFKMNEIFDEKGVEKIKAFILTQLEFLEDESLKILETAGFHSVMQCAAPQPKVEPAEIPFAPEKNEEPDPEPEDDSDMIVVPEKLEKKATHSRLPLAEDKVEQIQELAKQGVKPAEISRQTGVSYKTATKYIGTISPGRSASRGQAVR